MRSISHSLLAGLAAGVLVQAAYAAPDDAPTLVLAQAAGDAFHMPVADAFKITGKGVVLTGRIASGSVNVGDSVCLTAAKIGTRTLKVEGIEMFRKVLDSARQGDMVGILVGGIEAKDITRGGGDRLTATCG